MTRYGSTAAKKLDDLIDDIGAKLTVESAQDEGESLSYADKVRAQLHAAHGYGTAAFQGLVLKTMVEQAKNASTDDQEQEQAEDEAETKRYGSTTAKRLDDWIALTASKLTEAEEETDVSLVDESDDGGLESHARARQQTHAYGTTDYQRRVWLDMVGHAKDAGEVSSESDNGQQSDQAESNEQQTTADTEVEAK